LAITKENRLWFLDQTIHFLPGGRMRSRGTSVLFFCFAFVAALLFAQAVMAAEPITVTPEEAKALIKKMGDNLVILDMRNPNEYAVAHFPGAILIPVNELEARISEVPTGKPVLVHCFKGVRAKRGCDILREKRPDLKEIYIIQGGEVDFDVK
jgi:rhodanese-related sulfurtransferase